MEDRGRDRDIHHLLLLIVEEIVEGGLDEMVEL